MCINHVCQVNVGYCIKTSEYCRKAYFQKLSHLDFEYRRQMTQQFITILYSTFKMDCIAEMRFRASDDGQYLVLKSVNEEHNHEVSKVGTQLVCSHVDDIKLRCKQHTI